jgi:hypothetical protein
VSIQLDSFRAIADKSVPDHMTCVILVGTGLLAM